MFFTVGRIVTVFFTVDLIGFIRVSSFLVDVNRGGKSVSNNLVEANITAALLTQCLAGP